MSVQSTGQSVRSDAFDRPSILLNRTLQEHRSELEHGSALNRTRHCSDVSRKDSSTHRAAIPLHHADLGEHSPASLVRHRRVRSRSCSYDSVSLRRHSRTPSRSRGKKKSHKKRKYSSTSSSSYNRSSPSSSRERARNRHKSKKKKHTSSRSSKRDKRARKHKRKRSPSPSPSVSSSSSSLQGSPARKKSRTRSRSPSSADEIPHDPAPRIESPALSRDHLSLYADDDEFNSHAEDQHDLVPEAETQSNVSSEDIKFQNLIEEVFKFLPSERFPTKTDVVLGGNRPRSSIEMEMMVAPKKSISLPQSKCPLIKAIDCLKQSLGAVEADGSYPMPSTITQD